jgi:methyl-accepting chemotaxis protein
MLKNIKIGAKLLIIISLLMVIPLAVVTYVSVSVATRSLENLESEQLAARSEELAGTIDTVLQAEKKFIIGIAARPDVIATLEAVEKESPQAAQVKINQLNRSLADLMTTKELENVCQTIICVNSKGEIFAAAEDKYLGVEVADRDYVKVALRGQVNTGAVDFNKVTGQPFVPVAAPIRSPSGWVHGVAAYILDLTFVKDLIGSTQVGETGYAFIIENTGRTLYHPSENLISGYTLVELDSTRDFAQKMMAQQKGVNKYFYEGSEMICGYAPVKITGWSLGLTLPVEEYMTPVMEVRNTALIVTAFALVLAFFILIPFVRSIVKPLGQAVKYARTVAEGDFTQRLAIQRRDEVGTLTTALNGMVEKLKVMVAGIRESAEQVAGSSEELASNAQQLSTGAQHQASTLEETSAAVEELTASVEQVTEHAQSQAASVEESSSNMAQMKTTVEQVSTTLEAVSESARESMKKAQTGAAAVTHTVEVTKAITTSFEQIAGIVNVISDIADQTNLLALNASIEAARAGEHGRGFAVVADAVSKLAERSASSAKEIETLIKDGSSSVNAGAAASEGVLEAMEEIISGARKTNEMVDALAGDLEQQSMAINELAKAAESINEMSQSISAATEEQTTNAKQVAKAIENVNELTQQAASASEEMTAATEELTTLSQQLQQLVERFRIGDEGGDSEPALPQPLQADAGEPLADGSPAPVEPEDSSAPEKNPDETGVALKKPIVDTL